MNKEVIAKRSTAALNQVLAIVLIVLGVVFVALGVVFYTIALRNDSPMFVRILFLAIFCVLGIISATFGIIQVFDNDENNRLYSFPLISYDENEDVYYAYDLKDGGAEIIFKKEDFVKLVGPSFITFGRVYLKYQKEGKVETAFIGFAKGKNADIVAKLK